MASPEGFTTPQTNRVVSYPLDLGQKRIEHYMQFDIYTFKKEDLGSPQIATLRSSVGLPIPANLSSERSYEYSDDDFNFIAKELIESTSEEGFTGAALGTAISNLYGDRAKIAKSALLKASGATGTAVSGLAANPRLLSQFSGMGYRTHSFTWDMIARNRQESDAINQIVTLFEYHSAPVADDYFLVKPDYFHITFRPSDKYLYKIGYTNLTSIAVSYNGGGTPVFFQETKAPVEVSITATFKETTIGFRNRLYQEFKARGSFGSSFPPAPPGQGVDSIPNIFRDN